MLFLIHIFRAGDPDLKAKITIEDYKSYLATYLYLLNYLFVYTLFILKVIGLPPHRSRTQILTYTEC